MAVLRIPDRNLTLESFEQVRDYLSSRGLLHERWEAHAALGKDASESEVLDAYRHALEPLMAARGYSAADVVSVFPDSKGIEEIRAKFLPEHVHSEDEVRFFVEGQGLFWFNLGGDEPVFSLLCTSGDLISVPAGTRHWFDLGAVPHVRAIRVFTDPSGWVARYTGSGVDRLYGASAT